MSPWFWYKAPSSPNVVSFGSLDIWCKDRLTSDGFDPLAGALETFSDSSILPDIRFCNFWKIFLVSSFSPSSGIILKAFKPFPCFRRIIKDSPPTPRRSSRTSSTFSPFWIFDRRKFVKSGSFWPFKISVFTSGPEI